MQIQFQLRDEDFGNLFGWRSKTFKETMELKGKTTCQLKVYLKQHRGSGAGSFDQNGYGAHATGMGGFSPKLGQNTYW